MSAKQTPKKARAKATPVSARMTAIAAEWDSVGLTSNDLLVALRIVVEGMALGDSREAIDKALDEQLPAPPTPPKAAQKIGRKSPRKVRQ